MMVVFFAVTALAAALGLAIGRFLGLRTRCHREPEPTPEEWYNIGVERGWITME